MTRARTSKTVRSLSWSIVSNKLRVAFDASSMRGRKTGIGVYTEQLLRALNAYAPEIETVLLNDNATVEQRTDKRIYREQIILPRLARNANAELLHLTGFAAPLSSRVPVVLTVMDLIGILFAQNFPPASRFYWRRYLPFSLRAARHLIALSENTKRDVINLARVPQEQITVIPPGLDARFCVADDLTHLEKVRARLNLPARYFLFVSTIEPRKGVDTLLEAYAQIAAHISEHLIIVGKRGWYFEALFAKVRAFGLEARVRFLDYVDDNDLPTLYNLATAFVFPSRYEGFGLTPLEAMACGAPVISSNASSLPEVTGDAGILCAPNDTNAFVHAMRDVAMNESLQHHLREKGLLRAKLFSWERAARQIAACYTENRRSQVSNYHHP